MVNLAFVVYRTWGFEIFKQIFEYQKIRQDFKITTFLYTPDLAPTLTKEMKKEVFCKEVLGTDEKTIHTILTDQKVSIACFYSWSFMVGPSLLKDFTCLCLHPSLLPKYRGGTPIQNQIMDKLTYSGITIFRMNSEIDGGDIYAQAPMSLLGNIDDIFLRMSELGTLVTKELIVDAVNNNLKFKKQDLKGTLIYKRRKPSQSIITIEEIKKMDFKYLNNLVRGLTGPYPHVSINFSDGSLEILSIEKYLTLPKNSYVISSKSDQSLNKLNKYKNNLYLQLLNSFVHLASTKSCLKK